MKQPRIRRPSGAPHTPRRPVGDQHPSASGSHAAPDPADSQQRDQVGSEVERQEEPTTLARRSGSSRVVDARDRFASTHRDDAGGRGGLLSRLRPRPWQRSRRPIVITLLIAGVLLVAALAALLFMPQFKLEETTVTGTGYVSEETITQVTGPQMGRSILLADTSGAADEIATIPGVKDAEVDRAWPNRLRVTVTEREPAAVVKNGSATHVVDLDGVVLPKASAQGKDLRTLTVKGEAIDPERTQEALMATLTTIDPALLKQVTGIEASTPSNVTVKITTDSGPKTIIWGTAEDGELKSKVVQALLKQPGSTIDVSAPHSPTTR